MSMRDARNALDAAKQDEANLPRVSSHQVAAIRALTKAVIAVAEILCEMRAEDEKSGNPPAFG